jgi:hypothetical protein
MRSAYLSEGSMRAGDRFSDQDGTRQSAGLRPLLRMHPCDLRDLDRVGNSDLASDDLTCEPEHEMILLPRLSSYEADCDQVCDLDFDADLFASFPYRCLPRCFARLDRATRKAPAATTVVFMNY